MTLTNRPPILHYAGIIEVKNFDTTVTGVHMGRRSVNTIMLSEFLNKVSKNGHILMSSGNSSLKCTLLYPLIVIHFDL